MSSLVRRLPLVALLGCLLSAGTAAAEDCSAALRDPGSRAATAAPAACTRIGPVALGMSEAQVNAALGRPEYASGAAAPHPFRVYVYPRDLAATLARQPQPEAEVSHSELRVVFQDHKVVALSAISDARTPLPFGLGDVRLGRSMNAIAGATGAQLRWNATRDEAFIDRMPLSFDVDDGNGEAYGVHVATDMAALGLGPVTQFHLRKDGGQGRVTGFRISVDALTDAH